MMGTDLSQSTYDKYASAVANGSIEDMGDLPDIFTAKEINELYNGGYVWIDTGGRLRVIIDLLG